MAHSRLTSHSGRTGRTECRQSQQAETRSERVRGVRTRERAPHARCSDPLDGTVMAAALRLRATLRSAAEGLARAHSKRAIKRMRGHPRSWPATAPSPILAEPLR